MVKNKDIPELPDDFEVPAPGEVVKITDRSRKNVRAAVNLRIHGASYAEIADVLEFNTAASARSAVEDALADMSGDVTAQRNVSLARHESLLRSLAPNALHSTIEVEDLDKKKRMVPNDQHLPYARAYLEVLAGISRLQGTNAPNVSLLVTPDAEKFQHLISEMAAYERSVTGAEEADIFGDYEDAEVVDDEP